MEPPVFDPFGGALVEGTLVRRYKRFLADVRLADSTTVTAHCPNSGSMLGMRAPGSRVLLSHNPSPRRKLAWTWEMVRPPHASVWIGCNTMRPNRVVESAILAGKVPGVDASGGLRREVPYGEKSRVDMVVTDGDGEEVFVEVKNTTLAAPPGFDGPPAELDHAPLPPTGNTALFPDAVTARGARHMDELRGVVEAGGRAAVVPLVNRADCDAFDVAADIDSAYHAALRRAVDAGVGVVPLGVEPGPHGWRLRGVLPWRR